MPEPAPWQVLQSETLLDFSPWLSVIRQSVHLPNGTVIGDYVLTPGRDFAMIVAATSAGEILLVRQYKHGLGRALTEFPAGYLDSPHEDPLACARRELAEETGYEARDWVPLGAFCLDPNRAATAAHFFLARDLERAAAPRLDHTEDLFHFSLPAAGIPDLLRSGEMPGLSCAAIWALAAPHLLG